MTATHAQTEQKRQDRSARRAEKHHRRARTPRLHGLIRPAPAARATKDAARGKRRLSREKIHAILASDSMPLEECRMDAAETGAMQERSVFGLGAKVAVVLSLVFYAAAISSGTWWSYASTSADVVFNALLGAAVGFQTTVLVEWQARRGMFDDEPRHLATFLLTFLGGGALLAAYISTNEVPAGLPAFVAASYLASPVFGVWSPRHGHFRGDQEYRTAQQEAQTFGLRVFFLFSALIVLADNFNILALPLWFVVALCVWVVVTTMTGKMWLLRRNTSGLTADPGH